MSIWNQDAYLQAWNFASTIHLGQTIAGSEIPYINHLGLVSMEATAAIAIDPNIEKPNLLILCAVLHDSIEDTNTSFEDIKHEFGLEVANGVLALSKNEKLPTKKEQMEDSISRIKQQPIEVWMVKLCDRITNLQPPPKHWDTDKILRYREEAYYILKELGEASQFLAKRLLLKIENYSQYIK